MKKTHWSEGLSVRAVNCLNNAGINSRKQTLEAYTSGRLHPDKCTPRGYGWLTHKQVAKFLGLPEPQRPTPKFRCQTCPHCGVKL